MTAYYNEIDPLKAETIREAIKAGAIAPGDVDERSITDVSPDELVGYTQCHFFAGGGFWSLAARRAGWPDDRQLWTGSCPCPSFSAAGKGGGFDDPRHLWPDWARLIRERKPPTIFGEQADDAVGYGWLDLVQTDLEAEAYAVGKVVFGAHSVGAPHIRQRLYFCAESMRESSERRDGGVSGAQAESGRAGIADGRCSHGFADGVEAGECADAKGGHRSLSARSDGGNDSQPAGGSGAGHNPLGDPDDCPECDGTGNFYRDDEDGDYLPCDECGGSGIGKDSSRFGRAARSSSESGYESGNAFTGYRSESINLVHAIGAGLQGHVGHEREWRGPGWLDPLTARSIAATGATRGFWADCDWWYGRDGKYRPIGPGLQPLAHGSSARVGRLRMYGDAICVSQAQAFIEAYLMVKKGTGL